MLDSEKRLYVAHSDKPLFVVPKMASVEVKGEGKAPDWVEKLEALRKK